MRILTLSYEFPPLGGGGARVAYGVARTMVERGHEVDLITMRRWPLPAYEKVDGIGVHRIPCVRLRKSVCSVPELATYVVPALCYALRLHRRQPYDVNHTHFIFPDGFVARTLRQATGLPYVVTAHGSDVPGYNPDRFAAWHKVLSPAWSGIVDDAASVVCQSNHLGDLFSGRSGLATERIPNGIDPGRFRADRVRHKRVLVVSRLLRRKGVQYVVEALRDLPEDWTVSVVGDGPYLPTLRSLAAKLDARIEFHGWLDHGSRELRDLYETSSIFVLPSEAENFPVVLLEAMAAGLAIVTTRSTGCAEAVGDAAVLVPRHDPEAIRAAVTSLMDSPELCAAMGRAGRTRLERNYSWNSVARSYERLFDLHVLGAAPAPAAAYAWGA